MNLLRTGEYNYLSFFLMEIMTHWSKLIKTRSMEIPLIFYKPRVLKTIREAKLTGSDKFKILLISLSTRIYLRIT